MTLTTRVSSYGSYSLVKNRLCRCDTNTHTHNRKISSVTAHGRMFTHLYRDMARSPAKLPFSLFPYVSARNVSLNIEYVNQSNDGWDPELMALIIQPSAAESWRPPPRLRYLPLNLLTPISLVFVCSRAPSF